MVVRPFWIQKIQKAWDKRSIVWLSGVRRVGKTTLARMFSDAVYFNCDLPSVVSSLEDPEWFFDNLSGEKIVIFDEIHRTPDPSRILKIAADSYPHFRILATGSSTLAATRKFRDTLTGRKIMISLPPVLWEECKDVFGINSLDKRLLNGGLPEPLMAEKKDPYFFSEWMDSFYARDVQELFGVRNRTGFLNLLKLLLRQSGGLIDYLSLSKLSGISRPAVKSYIEAMLLSQAIFLVTPFHGGGRRELTRRPKAYAFDTGFVTFLKGWDTIRDDDRGVLWEHLVLDTILTMVNPFELFYWRDKSGREIDFVVKCNNSLVTTIECKINPDQFNIKSLSAFRKLYPYGKNIVISPLVKNPYKREINSFLIEYHNLSSVKLCD